MYYIIKKNRKGVEILLFAAKTKHMADKLLKQCPRTAYIVNTQPIIFMYEVVKDKTKEVLFYTPDLHEAIRYTEIARELTSVRPLGMQITSLKPYKKLLW